MNFDIETHFRQIVLAQVNEYFACEEALSSAVIHGDEDQKIAAEFEALRQATNSVWQVHHFAELVLTREQGRASRRGEAKQFIDSVEAAHCQELHTSKPSKDMTLLGDTADALKHCILSNTRRMVSANGDVMTMSKAYGAGAYGAGKYGGISQVVIIAEGQPRPLTGVLRNVLAAWREYLQHRHGILA